MAADLYRILEILSATILILSLVKCLFSHNRGPIYVNAYGKLKNPSDLPILIEVYYEALDDVSEDFITQQLIPTYEKLNNITEVLMVPYIETRVHQNSNGSHEIQCLLDPIHCEANLQHACIMDKVKDTHVRLHLIGCLVRNDDSMVPSDNLNKCSEQHKYPQAELIKECAKGTQGLELLKRNGEMTAESSKGLFKAPFIVINGSTTLEAKIIGNLFANVCKHVNGSVVLKKACEK